MPLDAAAFDAWAETYAVLPADRAYLAALRQGQPVRRLRATQRAGPVRFPSRKMGVIVQCRSRLDGLPMAYELEHDAAVLEIAARVITSYQKHVRSALGVTAPCGVVLAARLGRKAVAFALDRQGLNHLLVRSGIVEKGREADQPLIADAGALGGRAVLHWHQHCDPAAGSFAPRVC